MFKASIISIIVLPITATCALAQANTMTSGALLCEGLLSRTRMTTRPLRQQQDKSDH